MSRCSVVNFLHSFFFNNSKRAFTLAEALIITVMTGACLLPILGTMQNAQVRTENFDHQSKMQQYARSRLTQEIANAAFDHKSINLDDEYHYIVYFASSTSNENATEDEAKLIELPKSYATLEDLASLTIDTQRSRWATSAVELLGISRDKGAPYLKVVHAYKTSVETQYDIKLATYTPGVDSEGGDSSFPSPKGLLAIVVKTCLLESNGQMYHEDDGCLVIAPPIANADGSTTDRDVNERVSPVTLFSFANLPIVSDEYIWIADSHNKKVVGIDPESRTLATEIDFKNEGESGKPLHIAVHPSGKILAVQAKKKVFLVNIDIKSPFKGERKLVVSNSEDYATEEEGGIAFRTDGKVLYFTDKHSKLLHIYEFNYEKNADNVLKWDNSTPSTLTSNHARIVFSDDKFSNIVAANDGNLYIGENDSDIIHQYPMYSVFTNGNSYETVKLINTDKKIRSIDVSNDGKYLLYTPKEHTSNKSLARIYDTKTGKIVKTIEAAKELSYGIFSTISNKDSSVTDSSLFVVLTEKKKDGDNGAGVQVFGLDDKTCELQNSNIEENGRIIQSPYDSKVIFISKMKKGEGKGKNKDKDRANLYFSDFLYSSAAHNLTDEEAMVLSEEKGIAAVHADLAANKRDIMAVAKENKHIDLYDLNTLKKLEDENIIEDKKITSLSMNPQGDTLLASHGEKNTDGTGGGTTSFSIYHLNDLSKKSEGSGYGKNAIFDDRTPNMAFTLEYPKTLNDNQDAFWNINSTNGNNGDWDSDDSYCRKDFNLHSDWQRLDMIGMPRGGALVLYGKTDGSSMLEWIGRRNWAQDSDDKKGKYRLFSRWTNIKGSTKGASKTLPNYSLDSWGDQPDGWIGRVAIMRDIELPVNGKVVSLNVKSTTWTTHETGPGKTSHSLTPLLLEMQSNGEDFKIKDVGVMVDFNYNTIKNETITINWQKNGGLIVNSNYRLGFWNGRVILSSVGTAEFIPTAGAIPYKSDTTNYAYVADYYKAGSDSGETGGVISEFDIANSETLLKPFPSINEKKRNYALSFNIKVTNNNEFPPLGSKKLAITPNQSMLAILATNTSDVPIVNLYDFNNQIYDNETQIEGMLVDYRDRLDSGEGVSSQNPDKKISWPHENISEPLFTKVATNCRLGGKINTFAGATTKNESWTSFKEYPANYYFSDGDGPTNSNDINKYKSIANKRFFGYFRPEYKAVKFQSVATEDVRYFYNDNYIYGRTPKSVSGLTFIPNSVVPTINCYAYDSGKLQIDQGSDAGGMYLGCFISDETATEVLSDTTNHISRKGDSALTNYYEPKLNGWNFLMSEQTYILNNRPSFMASFKAQIGTSSKLDITNTSMLFSRDRAKPVLYLTVSTYLWALYRNSLIRVKQDDDSSIKTNLAISTDGQKLLYGKTGGTSGVIRVVDISSPDDSKFRNTVLTTKEENVSGFSNSYLSKITDLSLDSAPSNLAIKPFNSYSSEKTGGNYELMATEDFSISSNAVAVASGGIYIVNNASSTIGVYNPVTSYNTVEIKNDVLEKNANSVAVTAYDDTLYLFGNAGNGTDDAISGRVQSYDVNSEEARTSFQRSGDTYRASIYYNSSSDYVVIEGDDNGVSDKENTFMNNNSDWINSHSASNITYSYFTGKPFVVNKININNDAKWASFGNVGTKDFRFVGINGTNEIELCRGQLGNPDTNKDVGFKNNVPYEKYKFYADSTHAVLNHVGLKQLTFYRTDLVRLTPKSSSEVIARNNTNHFMNYSTSKVASATIIWSNPSSNDYNFSDIIDNIVVYDDYEGGGSQGWQSSDSKPYLKISFEDPEVIRFLRYANGNDASFGYVTKIHIYGNNNNEIPSVSNTPTDNGWIEVAAIESLPNVKKYWIPQEISNNNSYKHYLFVFEKSGTFRITAFEVYGQANNGDSLTPMLTDDLDEVKAGFSAACATPYGLVVAGGKDTAGGASLQAILYWPHAINKYDGQYYQHGISRSLPNMKTSRMQHTLVWHKGRIYAIGGKDSTNPRDADSFAEYLDYNSSMEWQKIAKGDFKPDGENTVKLLARYNHGACSFGDEIFIFGGTTKESSDNKSKSAYAWNPETGNVRKLADLEEVLSPCSAVAFGSKIYVIGMGSSNKLKIYEYTP